ncbi:MAG TPA: glutamine-hydrolyzing carbamoyl-phosphate synthase small subunit [Nitrospiraceae bacterium]|jgi:carbamoyl-phosphate synthase small subunit|nr:glutamine-hydrolyzing carbamoyl-phosphate synthase small subunit [Nitrospiraceae bacterium]
MKKAILALADGTVFEGRALGYEGEAVGEVVFNTAMTGYQEILSDPSYKGQIVTMTCPHIGNYGVTREDVESRRLWAEGFIVRESSRRSSNWRAEQSLDDYLKASRMVGIEGLDTRALTRHLRDHGSQQGVISHLDLDPKRTVEKAGTAPGIVGRDLVAEVTCDRAYDWTDGSGVWGPEGSSEPAKGRTPPFRIVAYDFGIKQNILRRLVDVGCAVTVVPASTPASAVKAMNPDGIVLSNGPGDPEGLPYAVDAVGQLVGWRPMLCICLGHQILGLTMGLQTYKLKFGHHAANHPVMDLRSRKVEITSQNHNFAVRAPVSAGAAAGPPPVAETKLGRVAFTHVSLNDESIEGMTCLDQPVLSVQYHPEASPGPHDSAYLFRQFIEIMEKSHA